jgi:hypothetical protein
VSALTLQDRSGFAAVLRPVVDDMHQAMPQQPFPLLSLRRRVAYIIGQIVVAEASEIVAQARSSSVQHCSNTSKVGKASSSIALKDVGVWC